ncbi:hypothetical protein HW115_19310 [Verrucomicrobiaceae bacterium N1E253]|uniref:Uncharacterized protein n=1 Tax=Oceaniferula marina TaxID=2748318 RepID=A0A851GKA9_9BACT|nr:hypothetical protein [Oceaniferula marina]NWK57776.1 hypothetical protein [Oceaniferula marina]
MKKHKKPFYLYAGWILSALGLIWFFYLNISAEARITEDSKRMVKSHMISDSVSNNPEVKADFAVAMVIQNAVNEVEAMWWPFMFFVNGATFLLIHERNKLAEQVEAPDS